MNWLERQLAALSGGQSEGPPNVANQIAPTRAAIESAYPGLTTEESEDAMAPMKMAAAQSQAMAPIYAKKEASPLDFLAAGLSAASVPVAYAQGNTGFGDAMTGRTIADKWNEQNRQLETAGRANTEALSMEGFKDAGSVAQGYVASRRATKLKIKEQVNQAIATAVSTRDPQALQQALESSKRLLLSNNMQDEADALDQEFKANAQPPTMQPAPGAPPAPPPGPTSAAPSPLQPAAGAPPQAPNSAPIAPNQAPPAAVAPPSNPRLGEIERTIAQKKASAQVLSSFNPEAAKIAFDEIKILENEASDIRKAGPVKHAQEHATYQAEIEGRNIKALDKAPRIGKLLDEAAGYAKVDGMGNFIGPLQGSETIAPWTTDLVQRLNPWNSPDANPSIRGKIKQTQMALVAIAKDAIRVKGEGAQDQREFQAVIDTIGDLANARNEDQYSSLLKNAKRNLSSLLGVELPTSDALFNEQPARTSAPGEAASADAPPGDYSQERVATIKSAPIGTQMNGYVKTEKGWLPMRGSPGGGEG
jgi:hypothetical protein